LGAGTRRKNIRNFLILFDSVFYVKTDKKIFLIMRVLEKDENNLKNFKNQINDKIP
jgi:hypothetical protein